VWLAARKGKNDLMRDVAGLGGIGGIDYTVLLCQDITAMRDFYHEVMGFEIGTEVPGKWVEFRVGSQRLALRLRSRPYDGPPPVPEAASVQLAFRVPPGDIQKAVDQLVGLGVELLEPVTDFEFFDHRAFFFADPENNVIEIYAEI
jgi:catechol-2,3-dioxygenase